MDCTDLVCVSVSLTGSDKTCSGTWNIKATKNNNENNVRGDYERKSEDDAKNKEVRMLDQRAG